MKTSFKQELPIYAVTFFATSLILFLILYHRNFNFHIPIMYSGDALLSSAVIKTIIESGWYLNNPLLAAPFSFSMGDFPLIEGSNMLIIKCLSIFTSDFGIILNLFYILCFFLIAFASLYTFRRLGHNKPFAVVASLLFTFIPYHLLRGEGHLFLSAYYAVPIYILFVFSIFKPEKADHSSPVSLSPFEQEKQSNDKQNNLLKKCFYFLILAFASASGVYYAFFACFFFLVAGLMASVEQKNKRPLFRASQYIAVVCFTFFINILPNLIYHHQVGENTIVAHRQAFESEAYGLKLIHLFIPVTSYHSSLLAHLRARYYETAPLNNENAAAALGAVGSMGCLFLLALPFIRRQSFSPPTLYYLSRLNLAAVLLGTIGGFGSIFAFTVTPMIRCYNRISIFIAFFSLAAFFLGLQYFLQHTRFAKLKWVELPLAFFLICLGIPDQAGFPPPRHDNTAEYQNDRQFIAAIEKKLPSQSAVFQLPVMSFPEQPPIHNMHDYSHFRAYLHSNKLRWSYGAMPGRAPDGWAKSLASQSPHTMIDKLIYAGFKGIYINRDGYEDRGKALETEISTLLHQPPLVSPAGNYAFFDLQAYATQLKHEKGIKHWTQQVERMNQLKEKMDGLSVTWGKKMFPPEMSDHHIWHWSQNESRLSIFVKGLQPVNVLLRFRVKTASTEIATLWVDGKDLHLKTKMGPQGTLIKKTLTLAPGRHDFYFKTNATLVPPTAAHPAHLYYAIYDFHLRPLANHPHEQA